MIAPANACRGDRGSWDGVEELAVRRAFTRASAIEGVTVDGVDGAALAVAAALTRSRAHTAPRNAACNESTCTLLSSWHDMNNTDEPYYLSRTHQTVTVGHLGGGGASSCRCGILCSVLQLL